MAVLEKKWYVVRAVSGQENKVKNYIETEISRLGYADYVEQVLVPTEKVPQMRNLWRSLSHYQRYFWSYRFFRRN